MPPRHVFVYGTLRPDGDAFEPLLAPVATDIAPALLEDHALYGEGLPYPFVVPEAGRHVVGSLIEIDDSEVEATLSRLDAYEGEAYRRVVVEVAVDGGPVPCHLYVAAPHVSLSDAHRVTSGDWMRR